MVKNFSGKNLCNFIADRVVELIYHPCWRITLMQVIDTVFDSVTNPYRPGSTEQKPLKPQDLKPITDFLFQHFIKDSPIPFEGQITPLLDYFTRDGLYKQVKQMMRPSEDSLLGKGLEMLLPTVKELDLYTRVVTAFRKERISFEGDYKFWEVFLRESLNQLVAHQLAKMSTKSKLAEVARLRDGFVSHLLSLDTCKLRKFLLDIPVKGPILRHWEIIPHDPPLVKVTYKGSPKFKIIEDYIKE